MPASAGSFSNLKVAVEDVPEIISVSGRVADLVSVAPGVFEVCIEPSEPLHYIPANIAPCSFAAIPHGATAHRSP